MRLRVPTEPESWPTTNSLFPRTGFLNNFGAGGSNAAAVSIQFSTFMFIFYDIVDITTTPYTNQTPSN